KTFALLGKDWGSGGVTFEVRRLITRLVNCLSGTIPDFFHRISLRVCSFICSHNKALSVPARRIRDVLQPLTQGCDLRLRCDWQRDRDARAERSFKNGRLP